MSFAHWHEWLCHSNFSFLQAASHPHELVQRAEELQYRSLALADFDGVYGLARMFREHQKSAASFKLIYGAEIHLRKDHHLPVVNQHTIALFARTWKAYTNLCSILSRSHRHGKKDACISLEELREQDLSDLLVLIPMRGMIREASIDSSHSSIQSCIQFFKEAVPSSNFALTISRHLHPSEDVWISRVLDLCHFYNLSYIPSQDIFFHHPKRKILQDVLTSIRHRKTVDQCVSYFFSNHRRCMQDPKELRRLYESIPGIHRSMSLSLAWAESCEFSLSQLSYRYPKEMIPESHTPMSFLKKLVQDGCIRIYGDSTPSKIISLLQHELRLIEHLNFADYFLTIWDIVSWARSQNILCQGRGSAANSVVCFVLGITSLNPNEFEVLFERFISVERGDPPDIDVDFEHERREEVIQYIYHRYGHHRAAMVANVISFQKRGARREVALALGIPESMIQKSRRKFEVIEDSVKAKYPWDLWLHLSNELEGFPRHLGIHSGGFIITQNRLNEFVAYEPATMEDRYVVQWCKEDIEALNFFKIDILALGMLTAIRKCLALVEKHYHKKFEMYSIPQPDEATYAMVQKADTVGTFQVESRAQMSMLPRLKPACFYDLAVEVAIIRPGPITGKIIHPYLRRREGKEKVVYPDPAVKEILERTLGIPIFQEQVMKVAMVTGGFTPGEANELRRNMAAWGIKGKLGPWLEKLEVGMKARGIDEKFIEQILGHMRAFSEYGFPESHAVSFALIAYVSCYLKCHYPAAFFVSIINSQPMGFYSPHVLLQSARRAGVILRDVCMIYSHWDCTLEWDEESSSWAIRLGMNLVRNLSKPVAEDWIHRRCVLVKHPNFSKSNLLWFLQNLSMPREDRIALASANAFQFFDEAQDRRNVLWKAEASPLHPILEDVDSIPLWQKQVEFDHVLQDFRAISTSLKTHPVKIIKEKYWCFAPPVSTLLTSKQLQSLGTSFNPPKWARVFGMILIRQAPPTAKGMVFITLEDEDGFINLALAPNIYERFASLLETQNFLCMEGVLQLRPHQHSILVKIVHKVQDRVASVVPMKRKQDVPRFRMYSKSIRLS